MNYDKEYFLKYGQYNDYMGLLHRHYKLFYGAKSGLIIPCGLGHIVNLLNNNYDGQFHGMDVSPYVLENAMSKYVCYGDILDLPADNLKYDLVICADLLEHLTEEEVDIALMQINRVSTAKSYFVLRITTKDNTCFLEDETHKTQKSDEWWIDKVLEKTDFKLNCMSTELGEYVFSKGYYSRFLEKNRNVYERTVNFMMSKEFCENGTLYTLRNDGRINIEIRNDRCFRKDIYVSLEFDQEIDVKIEFDLSGYIRMSQNGKSIFLKT